ncbi:MAG: CDGSH iron-sulfur domain-containing protein [Clostridia bacterium]|jgi:CDGSH-type Zn-finger protein|nr:CDGSH iron-sulfur domain-containing protein [Clostridia bacterium]
MNKAGKIKVIKDGPYLVTGGIPLKEKIITPRGHGYVWQDGRELPQADTYTLCRCGKSGNHPFCDGAHTSAGFRGEETAGRQPYEQRAGVLRGPDLDLLDDDRCAFARFCHRERGDVWNLTKSSDDAELKAEAIEAAKDCPTGRLVAREKSGEIHEHSYEPCIEVIQDPQRKVSGGLFVKGYIPIEAADGEIYEPRNRITLCRCGYSRSKPFCDAMHVPAKFKDE